MRDRVLAKAKGDRDRRGRSFGRKRGRIANRSDSGDATADEVGHERRQAVVSAAEPVVLDDHALALYVPGFAEAFAKRGCIACGTIDRSTADQADHWSRPLARPAAARAPRAAMPPCPRPDAEIAYGGEVSPCCFPEMLNASRILFSLDVRGLNDRPPLLNLGFLKRAERFRGLLIRWRRL